MKKKKIVSLILILALLCAILSSCDYKKVDKSAFTVVSSFYPVYVFTKNITEGAENVSVLSMSDYNSGCLHDYQVLPADIKMIENSDLFIINGGGMEESIEKFTVNLNKLNIIDSSIGTDFIHSEHSHHHHEEVNPHIWMYIPNAIIQVKNITEALIKYNPENKEIYKANSKSYIKELEEIHKMYEEELKVNDALNVIAADNTFEYLLQGYGFNVSCKVSSGHNEQASAGKLKELINVINEKSVVGIFTEKGSDEQILNILNDETSCPLYYLNSTIRGDGEYKGVYENNMLENLEVLKKAIERK